MKQHVESPVDSALSFMEKARKLLMEQLTAPGGRNSNIAESLDLLDSACTYASNPELNIPACPACGSIYNESNRLGYTCLCCDHVWAQATQ